MERKQYEPTEKQIKLWSTLHPAEMPTDEDFKATWKRQHHNKETGWGMGKRAWVAQHANDHFTQTTEYQIGVWQGRVDALRGEDRGETGTLDTPFQNGYDFGFDTFQGFWKGYDAVARQSFIQKYGKEG